MRNIPVSESLVFLGTGKTAARPKRVRLSDGTSKVVPGEQEVNDDGVPGWTVDALFLGGEDQTRAEICGVKIYSYDEPQTQVGQPVKFVNLIAVPWVDDSRRVQMAFRADGIAHENGRKAEAA